MNLPLLRVYNGLFEIDAKDPRAIFDEVVTTNLFAYLRYADPDDLDALIFNVFYLKNPPPDFEDQIFSYEIQLWRDDYDLNVKMHFHDDIEIRDGSVYNLVTASRPPELDLDS